MILFQKYFLKKIFKSFFEINILFCSIRIIIFIIIFSLISLSVSTITSKEYYRSNANGLSLIKISNKQRNEFQYILQVDSSDDKIISKILYKDKIEFKKWKYIYTDNTLSDEFYYKNKEINESYKYDSLGHKVKQVEYLNNQIYKNTIFSYNKDGVVEKEEILNVLNNQLFVVKYKYDKDFRIKQIEKKYPDGRIVYWESFVTGKGIIIKEYYSLNNEIFTFYYNENGVELKGEVKNKLKDGTEELKTIWENYFSSNGKKERKEENDLITGKKIKTWFNNEQKETRIEIYQKEILYSIEEYEYNNKGNPIYYKLIHDLNLFETYFKYDKESIIIEEKQFHDKILKKIINYKKDGTKIENIYSKNNEIIVLEYDKDWKLIKK